MVHEVPAAASKEPSFGGSGGKEAHDEHNFAGLPAGLPEPQKYGDTTPCVKSLRSSYTGLYPQILCIPRDTEHSGKSWWRVQGGEWRVQGAGCRV